MKLFSLVLILQKMLNRKEISQVFTFVLLRSNATLLKKIFYKTRDRMHSKSTLRSQEQLVATTVRGTAWFLLSFLSEQSQPKTPAMKKRNKSLNSSSGTDDMTAEDREKTHNVPVCLRLDPLPAAIRQNVLFSSSAVSEGQTQSDERGRQNIEFSCLCLFWIVSSGVFVCAYDRAATRSPAGDSATRRRSQDTSIRGTGVNTAPFLSNPPGLQATQACFLRPSTCSVCWPRKATKTDWMQSLFVLLCAIFTKV